MRAPELNADLLDEFSDALWLEDGLSRNTLDSYRNDLQLFSEWLRKRNQNNSILIDATHSDLLDFWRLEFPLRLRPAQQAVNYQV